MNKEDDSKIFEEVFGFKLGDPRVTESLSFILKNWDHEKESYTEWYERTLAHDKHCP